MHRTVTTNLTQERAAPSLSSLPLTIQPKQPRVTRGVSVSSSHPIFLSTAPVYTRSSITIAQACLISLHATVTWLTSIACSAVGAGENCQSAIFSVDSTASSVSVYNLNTVGSNQMIQIGGTSYAGYAQNINVFPDTIALFRS